MGMGTILRNGKSIIHSGRVVTGSDPMCEAASYGAGAVLDRHCWFVSCSDSLGSECPIYHVSVI
jgi:hypothetical protein